MKGRDYLSNAISCYEERIATMYSRIHPEIDPNMIRLQVQRITNESVRDIPCQMHNNVTHECLDTTVLGAFDWISQRNPIISGNGTFFKQHSELLAPSVKMLEKLQADRKKVKKAMYQFKKGTIEYTNRNIKQMSIKVIMNADYGGSGTPMSPFYSAYIPPATTGSAKNITTSLICCLEFLSENNDAWAKLNSINELYDLIFKVLEDTRTDRVFIKASFTVEQVATWLLSRTNNVSATDRDVLKKYLSTLPSDELSKLMFAFNPRLVLREYVYSDVQAVADYLDEHQIDLDKIIVSDDKDIAAQTKEYIHECGYGEKAPEAISGIIERISKIILDNCVYPFVPNDAEVRAAQMKRIIVCVTDTDSLMVHFAHYLDDFQTRRTQNQQADCIMASAFGMRLFIEHVIPRMVEDIATFCNINDEYYRKKFVFKNEFAFLSMALFAKKMYAASMFVQEGNPRDPHEIAVTGMSFKKRDAAEFLEPIMLNLFDKYILATSDISIRGVLNEYNNLRMKLLNEVGHDPEYYKCLSVKPIDSYDQTKVLPAQMRGSLIWNNIMPDEALLPGDRVRVIPLSFKLLHEHQNDFVQTARILKYALIDNANEKTAPYICIPEHYHSIPDWIKPVIDVEYATDKLLMPFRQVFEGFDVYVADVPGGFRPSNMAFI